MAWWFARRGPPTWCLFLLPGAGHQGSGCKRDWIGSCRDRGSSHDPARTPTRVDEVREGTRRGPGLTRETMTANPMTEHVMTVEGPIAPDDLGFT